ncbi:hypothetical protein [Magnetospirillum molischianum]|uniref:hypothetical protein n=1 Tax=Magnetospirillum molischianum TaxID=1083 RepID=UPI0012DD9CF0|nr:hypothetical protein [Magnetospirillum molischianum]
MSISALAATTAQTNYPILVNGLLCYSSADVLAARSGGKLQKNTDDTTGTETTTKTASNTVTAQARAVASAAQTADAVGSATQSTTTDKTKDPTRRGLQVDLFV